MGVNKNIDDLKKELDGIHKLFDNILSDKKTTLKKTIPKKEITKEITKDKKPKTTDSSLTKTNFNHKKEEISKSKNIKNLDNTTHKQQVLKPKKETKNNSLTEEKIDNLNDITFTINDSTETIEETSSKIINLHRKSQYLSIRNKLEKIKNEIKEKELKKKLKNR